MIGSELAPYADYIIERAVEELNVSASKNALLRKLAGAYISIFGIPEVGAHLRIRAAMAAIPEGAEAIIDVGCGPGMLVGRVEKKFPLATIVGLELDESAAAIARVAHPRAKILTGDFLDLDLPLKTFDCATLVDVLEHIPDEALSGFLDRIFALLKPGGKIIVHVPAINQRRHFRRFSHWEHHDHEREGFSKERACALLENAGFADVSSRGTFGFFGSLGWEVNMLAAGGAAQATIFPLALAVAGLDGLLPSSRNNGLLLTGRRAA